MYFRINELFVYMSSNLVFMYIPGQRLMVAPIEHNLTQVHSIMFFGQEITKEEFELLFPTDTVTECRVKEMYLEEVENEAFMDMLGETHVLVLGYPEYTAGESDLMRILKEHAAHL